MHPTDEPRADALPKTWDPGAIETQLYQGWVDAGYFTADAASAKPAYSIVLPPPNVTGSLHMGHALDHTLMDALTRRKRMQGYEVLWLPGMDHAGIATQSLVEKQLAAESVSKEDLGREAFVEKIWEWKRQSGGTIGAQIGGQSYAQVIFFKDKMAFDRFKRGETAFQAGASAVAANAGASTAIDYKNGVAVVAFGAEGLMLEGVIGGQTFTFEPIK